MALGEGPADGRLDPADDVEVEPIAGVAIGWEAEILAVARGRDEFVPERVGIGRDADANLQIVLELGRGNRPVDQPGFAAPPRTFASPRTL